MRSATPIPSVSTLDVDHVAGMVAAMQADAVDRLIVAHDSSRIAISSLGEDACSRRALIASSSGLPVDSMAIGQNCTNSVLL